jgi:uncharacterized protein YeaO (DUF488 family)
MIKTKRWNDLPERDDGFRVLVCRYRPRGLPKSDETWDAWWPELGPSRELHADYYGKHGPAIGFDAYAPRYLAEMQAQRPRIEALARRVAHGETITLLCASSCLDPERCHRTLLARLIAEASTAATETGSRQRPSAG